MIGGSSILSTLHTLDAAETVIHMFDLFPPHERLQVRAAIAMLAGTLKGIIGQRLIRTKDGKSRVAVCELIVTTERTKDFIMAPQQAGPTQTGREGPGQLRGGILGRESPAEFPLNGPIVGERHGPLLTRRLSIATDRAWWAFVLAPRTLSASWGAHVLY